MTRILVTALLLIAGCTGPCQQPQAPAADPVAGLSVGAQITGLSPKQLRQILSSPGPRPRVVNFWATWCPPCLSELTELDRYAVLNPKVDVILVNTDHPSAREGRVRTVLKERGLRSARSTQLDVSDPGKTLAELVPRWPDTLPLTLVLGSDGVEMARFDGPVTPEQIATALDKR